MRIWFDTEFYENGRNIELISIGAVREDGKTFYAETRDAARLARTTQWLALNVEPLLSVGNIHSYDRWEIALSLADFAGEKPEFWAYYADYDWVALCQLYGNMLALPIGWPMYCRDVKQLCDDLGNPTLPKQTTAEHHALNDAIWTKEVWEFLQRLKS